MLASLEAQLRLAAEQLRADHQLLSSETARLQSVRVEKGKALREIGNLQHQLEALERRVNSLEAEEAMVERQLREGAVRFAHVQVLETKIKNRARTYQGFQQSVVHVCGDLDDPDESEKKPFLSQVDVTTLRENETGQCFTSGCITCDAGNEQRSWIPAELLAQSADDVVAGYNSTIFLCRACEPAHFFPNRRMCCAPAEMAETLFIDFGQEVLERLSRDSVDAAGLAGEHVDRFRLSCSVVAVEHGGLYTDLLEDAECERRTELCTLPNFSESLDHRDTGAGGITFLATEIHVRSYGELVALTKRALQRVRASVSYCAPLLFQLRVELFSGGGAFKQSVARLLQVSIPSAEDMSDATREWYGSLIPYVKEAATLTAKSIVVPAKRESTLPSRDGVLEGAVALRRRLAALSNRTGLAHFVSPWLDPVFGGNTKAMMVSVVPDLNRESESAARFTVHELLECASLFHSCVRHAAVPFVVPGDALDDTRALEEVIAHRPDCGE